MSPLPSRVIGSPARFRLLSPRRSFANSGSCARSGFRVLPYGVAKATSIASTLRSFGNMPTSICVSAPRPRRRTIVSERRPDGLGAVSDADVIYGDVEGSRLDGHPAISRFIFESDSYCLTCSGAGAGASSAAFRFVMMSEHRHCVRNLIFVSTRNEGRKPVPSCRRRGNGSEWLSIGYHRN